MNFVTLFIIMLIWTRLCLFTLLGTAFYIGARKKSQSQFVPEEFSVYSVIIPAYNEQKHITNTLKAVLLLDPSPREIVVVSDGSTDMTAPIANAVLLDTENARVIELPLNRGKAEALNLGLQYVSAEYVFCLDADTIIESKSLRSALCDINRLRADAIALNLKVLPTGRLLTAIQQQEYNFSLNFERAALSIIGCISVLPGAATIFRRNSLTSDAYSGRTLTEDADLTLSMSSRSKKLAVSSHGYACTNAPSSWRALLRQRTRWTAGHIQCVFFHGFPGSADRRFRCLTMPNFAFGTFSTFISFIVTASVCLASGENMLGIDLGGLVLISFAVAYLSRLCAILSMGARDATSVSTFFMEPILVSLLNVLSFALAVSFLLRNNFQHIRSPMVNFK